MSTRAKCISQLTIFFHACVGVFFKVLSFSWAPLKNSFGWLIINMMPRNIGFLRQKSIKIVWELNSLLRRKKSRAFERSWRLKNSFKEFQEFFREFTTLSEIVGAKCFLSCLHFHHVILLQHVLMIRECIWYLYKSPRIFWRSAALSEIVSDILFLVMYTFSPR